jgi:hypothetical protein
MQLSWPDTGGKEKVINEIVSENITKSILGTLNLCWPNLSFFLYYVRKNLYFETETISRLNCIFGTLPLKILAVLAH